MHVQHLEPSLVLNVCSIHVSYHTGGGDDGGHGAPAGDSDGDDGRVMVMIIMVER